MARYTSGEIASFAETFRRDGVVMLPRHFDVQKLRAWAERFASLLDEHVRGKVT